MHRAGPTPHEARPQLSPTPSAQPTPRGGLTIPSGHQAPSLSPQHSAASPGPQDLAGLWGNQVFTLTFVVPLHSISFLQA